MNSEHRHNLEMLAAALAGGWTPMAFDMSDFCAADGDELMARDYKCGTVGCAVGHLPWATGIAPYANETWVGYSQRLTGLSAGHHERAWEFCFSPRWAREGNEPTARQAADRIAWVLDGNDVSDARELWQTYDPGERPWSGYFERSGRVPGGWHGLSQTKEKQHETR